MKYVVVDYPPTSGQLEAAIENCPTEVRKNNVGDKCILKYRGALPAVFINDVIYEYADIIVEMDKPEWDSSDE